MTDNGSLVDAFRSADTSGLPTLADLDDRGRAFWVLRVAQEQLNRPVMTPAEMSIVLRDAHGIDLSRQRIEATLSAERGTVAKRKLGKRRAYQLMSEGSEELDAATTAVIFIEPTSAFSGLREAQSLLGTLQGDLRVCDPYSDGRTLDMLAECQQADSIRLLTENIKSPTGFKQTARAFQRQHGAPLEVRKAPPKVLHDRYLIHDDGMLLFGTSLNGLGSKQSFVVALGEDIRVTVLAAFEATWDTAAPL
jgi:hypothetical protein